MRIIYIILFLISFQLHALDPSVETIAGKNGMAGGALTEIQIKQIEELIKKKNEEIKLDPKKSYSYNFIREEEIKNDRSCIHCPKYLLLTEQINKVVDNLAKSPKNTAEELPAKVNNLKFLFYVEALKSKDGQINCNRFLDLTPDLKPTKFDGQFKLMAEEVLKFNNVSEIQYIKSDVEEVVYYYRGESAADKNIIVQAILTKTGGKFRYFNYTPSEKESNPYNLPELGFQPINQKSNVSTQTNNNSTLSDENSYSVDFKNELEMQNKYIPKNVHFIDTKVNYNLSEGLKVKAGADTSLKGNEARISLSDKKNSDYAIIEVNSDIKGNTNHKVIVPLSIKLFDEFPVINGSLQKGSREEIVTMSLADKNAEYVRLAYRKDSNTNKESLIVAKDMKVDTNEVLSFAYIQGESSTKVASVTHTKVDPKRNLTVVIDFRINEAKNASVSYKLVKVF